MSPSKLVSSRGGTPLVLEQGRLYFHRYWQYENQLVAKIRTLVAHKRSLTTNARTIDTYFPNNDDGNWQRRAAELSVESGFSIITGGPGTGKTTTVAKILLVLVESSNDIIHIALAAPTGKAAMRLEESIGRFKSTESKGNAMCEAIPDTASTIHRLLGPKPRSPYFHHRAGKPLPYDVVIIDEASMVDLALMSKLMEALKDNARLILLGDADQLVSVESGAVLSDLSQALPERTVKLTKTYRFDENIAALADAVNKQQSVQVWDMLNTPSMANTVLVSDDLIERIIRYRLDYLRLICDKAPFSEIYNAFISFQVLCANRHGACGSEGINRQLELSLAEQGLIDPVGQWYCGRPVLISQNDHAMQLYNGDIGICLPSDSSDGQLMVYFQRADGSVKRHLPSRLTHCETVFAMTIHKSQGSEFSEVLIVMPELFNLVLTKELLYTAITRAKKSVMIHTTKDILIKTLTNRVHRTSGLVEKLTV